MKKLYQPPEILPILICMQDILTTSPGSSELDPDMKIPNHKKL